jgi:hypothetical protein
MDMKFEIQDLKERYHLEGLGLYRRLRMDLQQIQSKYVGLTQLALNRDHKQARAITAMNLWVS